MKKLNLIKDILDEKYIKYAVKDFIHRDPIQIPYLFSDKKDIEISAFITSTISWGRREMIIKNCKKIMEIMDYSPYDFIINHSEKDLEKAIGFVHRTFNDYDLTFFIISLKNIYENFGGLENIFTKYQGEKNLKQAVVKLNDIFFSLPHEKRVERHLSNPIKGSASKRINMFLRWMIRKDLVDFGLWKDIPTSKLSIPLDIHVGNVSRKLGFLKRKQNNWKAVEEIDNYLRKLEPKDPVKYDFALFSMGINDEL